MSELMEDKRKILVIDDERNIAETVSDILELKGFDVVVAYDGETGLSMAMADKPDLILCDIMMPGLSGLDVLKAIRENNGLSRIPFVFMTAKGNKEDFRLGMQMGADDYLIKPVENEELFKTINSRLKKHTDLLHFGHMQENDRIRNDLHDTLQQTILGVQMKLSNFRDNVRDKIDVQEIDESLDYIKLAMSQLRIILELDIVKLPEGVSFQDRLSEVLERISGYVSFQISFQNDFDGSLDRSKSLNLLKVIMEVLNNVIKHAKANKLFMHLAEEAEKISLVVLDDGVGFEVSQIRTGCGLKNIESRIKDMGGTVYLDSSPGAGTTFEILIDK